MVREAVRRWSVGCALAGLAAAWCASSAGAQAPRRAEELVPRGALALVAVRDIGALVDKARELGAVAILEAVGIGPVVRERYDRVRERMTAGLTAIGLGADDLIAAFTGGAFFALLDVTGDPPRVPQFVAFAALSPKGRAKITDAFELVRAMVDQGAGASYEFRGVKVTAIPVPDAGLELCWTFTGGGIAVATSRTAMEDFVARLTGAPAGDAFAKLPAAVELANRIGPGEDLVVLADVEAVLERFRHLMRPADRRRLDASGLTHTSAAYGMKVSPAIAGVRPGGVKEALVVAAPKLEGLLALAAMPPLGLGDMASMSPGLVGLRASLDAAAALPRVDAVLRATEGEAAANRMSAVVDLLCARFAVERPDLLETLSGVLTVDVAPAELRLIPDATCAFRARRPEGLAAIVEAGIAIAGRVGVKTVEFEGHSIRAVDPRGRRLPSIVSPCIAFDDEVLRGALSTQALKRALRAAHRAEAANDPGARPSAIAAATMELSPGPWMALALDVPRLAGVAVEIASLVPDEVGVRMRRVVDGLPPVDDLLDDLCGIALAVYGSPEAVVVESFSPVGDLATFVALAVVGNEADRARREPEPPAPPAPADRWEEPEQF